MLHKLLVTLVLGASLLLARPTVTPINYNTATIEFLAKYIPMPPGTPSRLDIYTYDEDLRAQGYKVIVYSGSQVLATRLIETMVLDGKVYGFISIPGEFPGTVHVVVEALYGSGEVVSNETH